MRVDDVLVVKKKNLRIAISGTVVGNFMEWFDFGVYGYLAVTLSAVFTGDLPEGLGLLVTLLGFAISFLVRPLGGLVLGPLGDRIGRQRVLFFTMAMMATATALIGVLPTSAQIGLWAIIPLYLLKMVQGFSTGGEYAGATTYVSEFSPDRSRGFWSSFLDVGSYVGFAAGASVVALTTWIVEATAGETGMLDFGWRIPFLVAIPLGAVAIWFRLKIPETPAYEAEQAAGLTTENENDPLARHGIIGIFRHHWREVLIAIALVAATNTAGYALTSYMPTYLEKEVGVTNLMAALATVPVLVLMSACLPFIGRLSDRIGRKPVYAIAVVSTIVLMVPAFAVMQIGEEWAVMIALAMVAIPVAFYVAISASALPALFPTASRFGAMAIAYNVAVSLFGGTTPLFSQALIELTGNTFMPAFYIMFFAALGGVALLTMRETAKRPLIGSFPAVETSAEAKEIVEGQDDNPYIDTSTMPLDIVSIGAPPQTEDAAT
ncbi:MFS transporter [Microbacterium pseudoresistens]|uniref:MHS family proline/betaine transporter-like MFS transporter n=1 Tax=Microbacterium pseudoresistens TaxID=640634 RepID=A0A7Y9JM55_9MICO|nr:MFS transporter [Microbacterium pseudoresistens]NYD53676.1 MHS family proline/betaine transporter-like MFS transporter [Microbacterium pseudoresistens]